MTATKPDPITPFQIKRIMQNCAYQVETKNEWVQWVTGDANRTSLKSITHDEAIKILLQQTGAQVPPSGAEGAWGKFDHKNPKHKVILSLLHQLDWTTPSTKYGTVPDIDLLSNWLQSDKSPVKKPLMKMETHEVEKTITALSGIVKSRFK